MKKKLQVVLCVLITIFMVVGCTNNLKKETPNGDIVNDDETTGETNVGDSGKEDTAGGDTVISGDLKTGLAVVTSLGSSLDAGEKDGIAQTDSTVVAVTVDEFGMIVDCIIDGVQAKINFSSEGMLLSDKGTVFKTKNEQGTDYGMSKASPIGKEWNEQAQGLADYVIGKTIEDVKNIAITDGIATDTDLVASITINISDYLVAIEKAVVNSKNLGGKSDDVLGLAIATNMESSTDVGEKDGLAQTFSTFAAVTTDQEGVITSCVIDETLGNVNFDESGKITSDLTLEMKSKNELGSDYGMVNASSIGKEWNEQVLVFAEYVVGKTVEEVEGIAITEGKATDTDLVASVTLNIEDFISLVVKASNFK